MAKKKSKKLKKLEKKEKKLSWFALPKEIKCKISGIVAFILAIIVTLSFFEQSGAAGQLLMAGLTFLIGKTLFSIPFILIIVGFIFFTDKYQKLLWPISLAIFIFILGASGFLHSLPLEAEMGGWLGFIISWPLLGIFGPLVAQIIFVGIIIVSGIIFWHLLGWSFSEKKRIAGEVEEGMKEKKASLAVRAFKKIVSLPKFKVEEVPSSVLLKSKLESETKTMDVEPNKSKEVSDDRLKKLTGIAYQSPPLDLLEKEKEVPTAGDTRNNSVIIKKTLENFDIPVEMSEINIGPTVTQYTFKPAEGIKLSKITGLTNDLSLALACHPIRIEAPIPGKSLVGIEVPNKGRAQVRLKDLIANPSFQKSGSDLSFVLGRDVSGRPVYADLARMPHLLVAGSTGAGKTIFLNNFILSLLYRNSPETLRIILIDPKRVEFSAYHGLPHLLTPVIFDSQKTINVLKWLVLEMERRFDILSSNGSRNISSYNEKILKEKGETIPYIVLIIDELADLMAARGREVEAGIVRLAQMARAVGIHLVVATQRPSVEVITGLIKANISSRITFQVASQVDSRTVLDMAGAEKLLGLGDMLFVSAEIVKPRRIQGSYITEKEVRKVVDWIGLNFSEGQIHGVDKSKILKTEEGILENGLEQDLAKELEIPEADLIETYTDDDQLYEEAKKIVIESKKASASLLQRRLRLGYARAARLVDMLEERGVVGPGEGAKPREVYSETISSNTAERDEEGWQKI